VGVPAMIGARGQVLGVRD